MAGIITTVATIAQNTSYTLDVSRIWRPGEALKLIARPRIFFWGANVAAVSFMNVSPAGWITMNENEPDIIEINLRSLPQLILAPQAIYSPQIVISNPYEASLDVRIGALAYPTAVDRTRIAASRSYASASASITENVLRIKMFTTFRLSLFADATAGSMTINLVHQPGTAYEKVVSLASLSAPATAKLEIVAGGHFAIQTSLATATGHIHILAEEV